MATRPDLLAALAAAVRSGTPTDPGATTAADVRAFLTLLLDELLARTPAPATLAALAGTAGAPGPANAFVTDADPRLAPADEEQRQTPYLFQVGAEPNDGLVPIAFHVAKLSVAQARYLVETPGATVALVSDEVAGHQHTVTVAFDPDNHTFVVVAVTAPDGTPEPDHAAWLIGGAAPAVLAELEARLSSQLAGLAASLQGQVLVQSAATGVRTYCASWEDAHAAAAPGDVVTFGPGIFGEPGRVALIQKDLEVRLHASTTWQFSILYLHTGYQATRRRVCLAGEGRLQGTIMWYGDTQLEVVLRNVRHEGNLVHNAYLTPDSTPNQLLLDGVRFAAPPGTDYLTAFTRYGGYYFKPLAATVRGVHGTVPSGAFYHNTGSGGNPADAAGNLLTINCSHLECAPDQPLVLAPDGVVSYDFAQVSYAGLLPPSVAAAPAYHFLGLPAGGAAGGSAAPGLEVLAVAPLGGYVAAYNFTPVPVGTPTVDVRPAGLGGGWDVAAGQYVAPVSGTYELHARLRIYDGDGPVGANYALGAGPDNVDGEWMLWSTIFQTNATNRKGSQTTRVLHLNAGQAVRQYVYLDGFGASLGGEFTVKLLRRD
ncbi:hypothetical protein GCM10027422_43650 [Hymenobacter arcticus]